MTKQKILILGAKPVGTLDIVNYAKSLGCYVIVCDYLKKEEVLAKQIADEAWDYSTADVDLIVSKAKEAKVNAVFTGVHEFNLDKCQKICEKLNLPFYVSKETLSKVSNKRIYKDIFKNFGIPVIKEYEIKKKISDDIEFPILLKPIDSSGAYGLQICKSEEELKSKIDDCLKYSDKKTLLAEKYIENKEEITTVYFIKNGVPYLASVADRIVKHFNNSVIPLPIQYIWHSKYLDLYEKTIDEKMKKAIQFMNLKNGMLFIQSIVKDDVIMPYDIGFRLSGVQEHIILEKMCGYNPLKLLVDYALFGKFRDEKLIDKINPHFKGSATQITFLVNTGTIGGFEGIEEVEKMPEVIRVIKNKFENETIPKSALGTLNQVALRVFVKVKNQDDIEKITQKIRNTIKIYSDKKTNLSV